jgi:ribonuclease E
MDWGFEGEGTEPGEVEAEAEGDEHGEREVAFTGGGEPRQQREEGQGRDESGRRRRRRRGRRGGGGERMRDDQRGTGAQPREFEADGVNGEHSEFTDEAGGAEEMQTSESEMDGGVGGEREAFGGGEENSQDEQGGRRRRRGRRGGRRGRDRGGRPPHSGRQDGEAPAAHSAAGFEPQPIVEERSGRDEPSFGGERAEMPALAEKPVSARAVSEPEPVSAEPAAAPARSRSRARNAATSGEPKIERVVVKPDQVEGPVATEPGVLTSEPTRRGWWQRRLGSE